MPSLPESSPATEEAAPILFADFLEKTPPNQTVEVSDLGAWDNQGSDRYRGFATPELRLHCPEPSCGGLRFFRCITLPPKANNRFANFFLIYRCANCQRTHKTFSLAGKATQVQDGGPVMKFGEQPAFGPPTPSKLITLIGPDRDTFLKGRRCENQGLGIGAFIYYRRVVENQKSRILKEIIKLSQKIGASESLISTLESAVAESRFSQAIDMARPAIPESLLIGGHNPLLLLHSALSEGVHERTDEECLSFATSIRVILAELSERIGQALKDEDELRSALSTLMNRKS